MAKLSKKIKVGVIFGGRSGEHEVSIVSAQSVIAALDPEKFEVVPIGITKEGKWIAGSQAIKFLKDKIKVLPFKSVLSPDPTEKRILNINEKSLAPIGDINSFSQVDVILPVMHGTTGEDGCLQGLLEMANLPYVGAGVLGSAIGMDKVIQKQLLINEGVPVVDYNWFLISEFENNADKIIEKLEAKLQYPMFTKPANSGSSVGIEKCHNQKELYNGIMEAGRYDRKILVEQGIENAKEVEIAVLGNDQPMASVPGQIMPSNEFYDYDAKYIDGSSEAIIPALLEEDIVEKIQNYALRAFRVLDLAGLARVDFLLSTDNKKIYLNEVNTLPGFTSISMYPKLWEASRVSYSELLEKLIELALRRHEQKNKLLTSYQPKKDWYK